MEKANKEINYRLLKIRLLIVACLILVGLLIALVKSGTLQLIKGEALSDLADRQYLRSVSYSAPRGNIYDREGKLLSTSIQVDSIYAEPNKITQPHKTARLLKKFFHIKTATLVKKLSSDSSFAWIARRINPETARKIKKLNIKGIGFTKEDRRFYPNHALLGQTLGLVSIDGQAVSGIEKAFDEYLQSRNYSTVSYDDAKGQPVRAFAGPSLSDLQGDALFLTIDRDLQYTTEQALLTAVQKHHAKAGWAIVMNPKTGEILALANVPLFNPNAPTKAGTYRNNVISRTGEPGSTFKIITFAAGFETNSINLDKKIYCEKGKWDLGYMTIRDTSKKEWLTPTEIFQYSSNIGTFKIAQQIGKEKFGEVINRFGFGKSPGLKLMEESKGSISDSKDWGKMRFANISFGYGFMANSLQLALATAAIANDGVKVSPKIILNTKESPITKRIISSEAAKKMTQLMVVDIEKGTGKAAAIEGVTVAGKTGTTEKVDPKTGKYAKSLNISSFIGFAPADNPEVLALVVIDEPQGIAYGGTVAAPAWKEVVTAALMKQGLLFRDSTPSKTLASLK